MKLPIYKFNKIKLQYDKIVLNFKTILIYILIQLIITIGLIFLLSVRILN